MDDNSVSFNNQTRSGLNRGGSFAVSLHLSGGQGLLHIQVF